MNKIFTGKTLLFFLHFIVWVILFIFPAYLIYVDSSRDINFLFQSYFQIGIYAILFYINYLWLTPRLFFRQKKLLYFVSSVSLVVLMTLVNIKTFDLFMHPGPNHGKQFEMPPPSNINDSKDFRSQNPVSMSHKRPSKNWPTYNFLLTTLLISGFGMGLGFSDKLIQNEKQRKDAEKEKLNTELAFLKNQINPHFFFNTLNNIYSLVQINVDDGQKAILQLSKLMRYLLYETEKGDKRLSEEIAFMKTYIELMKLRLSDKVEVSVEFPENYTDVMIPPLLFLPYIENAFKHGISYRRSSFIKILMKIDSGVIKFECSNSIGKTEDAQKSLPGIGLENARKRLAILFPEKHEMRVTETETTYSMGLSIQIAH